MRKLFFQKLVRGIKYVLIFLAVYILGANVLVTIANFFKDHPLVQMLVLLGIPAVIVFFMATSARGKDRDRGKVYKQALGDRQGNFQAELGYVLRSADYRAELLAAVAYVLLYVIIMVLPKGGEGFALRLLTDLLVGVIIVAVFAVVDLVSWLRVHKKFRLDKMIRG